MATCNISLSFMSKIVLLWKEKLISKATKAGIFSFSNSEDKKQDESRIPAYHEPLLKTSIFHKELVTFISPCEIKAIYIGFSSHFNFLMFAANYNKSERKKRQEEIISKIIYRYLSYFEGGKVAPQDQSKEAQSLKAFVCM